MQHFLSMNGHTCLSSQRSRNLSRFCSWSMIAASIVDSQPSTARSSAITLAPARPSVSSCIFPWNASGALPIPNGIRFQRYRPNGVLKVVSWDDLSSKQMCQNPQYGEDLGNMQSRRDVFDSGKRTVLSLNSNAQVLQILNFPFFLGTTTIDNIHGMLSQEPERPVLPFHSVSSVVLTWVPPEHVWIYAGIQADVIVAIYLAYAIRKHIWEPGH